MRVKAGSQSDARPCVALIHETHKFITKKVGGFLTTRCKNATQGNARIGSESILVSYCVSTSVDVKTTQRNTLFSVVLWTGLYSTLWSLSVQGCVPRCLIGGGDGSSGAGGEGQVQCTGSDRGQGERDKGHQGQTNNIKESKKKIYLIFCCIRGYVLILSK